MDATFRMRRSYRNEYMACMLVFLAWGSLGVCAALFVPSKRSIEPDVPLRLALAAVAGGIPMFLAGLSLWGLAACRREELTIRDERIVFRGVLRRRVLDLRDVIEARWRTPLRGLVLRSGAERFSLSFARYEDEESARIIHHLRSAVSPEVQTGWNLFAYREESRERRLLGKPGPDEILLRRDRWDGYIIPILLITFLGGFVGWYFTGDLGLLLVPSLATLLMWGLMRSLTPARGMVATRFWTPGTARFQGFLLLWALVAIAGVTAHGVLRPRLAHPDAFGIVGAAVWFGVLIFEAAVEDRRRAYREREAADQAAKGRGEVVADPWPAD